MREGPLRLGLRRLQAAPDHAADPRHLPEGARSRATSRAKAAAASGPAGSSTTTRSCRTSARRPGRRRWTSRPRGSRRSTTATARAAIAGFGSAKCSNEEAYLFQKLIRAGFGTNNVDHCTRLCHASSVAALLEGVGSGAVSTTYGDIINADVAILAGTNTTANHPVASSFFKQARRRGTKLIVVDPRRERVADHADVFCQIKPGTDVAFYNGVLHEVIRLGLVDREFIRDRVTNFGELAKLVKQYPPERAAQICGIDAATIREVARLWGEAGAGVIYWGMGISQHTTGTDNSRCLIAMCAITGHVGRPGTGLHPLRGQNNVQGASDAGLIPMMFPDYQRVDNAAAHEKFEAAWGAPLDAKPGLTVTEIVGSALKGGVRGMYMMGENPFLSDPNINKVRKALAALEFLVVQDIFLTETAEFADVVLPATSFLEKDGTYTNTDRRVQIGRKVLDPPGQARPDWEIIREISTRIGLPMEYESVSDVFDEMVALVARVQRARVRQPRAGGQALPERRIRSTPTAPSCCSGSRSRPTTARRISCPPSGCRPRSCPTRSTRSYSTPAGCSSTGTPAR